MKIEEILQLVDCVSKSTLAEFKYEEGGVKLSLKKTAPGQVSIQPMVQAALPVSTLVADASYDPAADIETVGGNAEQGAPDMSGNIVKSPLVGTFYTAPSEDAEPFVKVGDSVKEGQVLAIVEAMKLMNDIESDFTGTITEILVENGEAVEYGQPLFVIK